MGLEIERKFLVKGEYKSLAQSQSHIVQGYLCAGSGRSVRIRIRNEKAYVTIKGPASADGMSRFEWETEVSLEDGQEMIGFCEPGVIDKDRYLVPYKGYIFEVDEFHADNEGLVICEVELGAPDEVIPIPPFLGKEVTGDKRYYNSHLREYPYTKW